MKARMQLAMMKLEDPRVVRVVLLGLALAMAAIGGLSGGAEAVYACPTSGGGGCSGG